MEIIVEFLNALTPVQMLFLIIVLWILNSSGLLSKLISLIPGIPANGIDIKERIKNIAKVQSSQRLDINQLRLDVNEINSKMDEIHTLKTVLYNLRDNARDTYIFLKSKFPDSNITKIK